MKILTLKNYSHLIRVLVVTLLLLICVVPVRAAHAQTTEKRMVVMTEYPRLSELDFFFDNSTYALGYYDGNIIDPSVFLSIVTQQQYDKFVQAGFKPEIIDENASEITRYYELTNRRAPSQQDKLLTPATQRQGLQQVYKITRIKTLIKLAPRTQFATLQFPGKRYYKPKQLTGSIDRPSNRAFLRAELARAYASEAMEANKQATKSTPTVNSDSSNKLLALVVLILVLGFIIVSLNKNKKNRSAK